MSLDNIPPADNVIQLGPVKKTSVRPPDPLIKPAAPPVPGAQAGDLMLAPFPDGVLFRCSPKTRGLMNGPFVIHDGAGLVVGLCVNQAMANLFCLALDIYFKAAKQNVNEQVNAAAKVEETLAAPVSGNAVLDESDRQTNDAPYCEEQDSPSPEAGK